MTVIDQIFYKVAEIAIPHFFITVEFSASGTEMPEHIEAFLQEKYEVILRGASGRKFIYKKGEWRGFFFFALNHPQKAAKLHELFFGLHITAFKHLFRYLKFREVMAYILLYIRRLFLDE
jgi:hypothetical protein